MPRKPPEAIPYGTEAQRSLASQKVRQMVAHMDTVARTLRVLDRVLEAKVDPGPAREDVDLALEAWWVMLDDMDTALDALQGKGRRP